MLIQSPSEYLKNKTKQEQTPYVINNDGEFYDCKGLLVPRSEFDSYYPMAEKVMVRHEGQYKDEGIGSGKKL